LAAAASLPAQPGAGVALNNGVISYLDSAGGRSEIKVGGPCADLWISPDGDTIAFIRIDRSQPDHFALAPFIEASTIFVASRSARFAPVRVAIEPPKIDGRIWKVFHAPVLSPGRDTVYFLVPAAGTSWFLMSAPVTGGAALPINYVEAYCVLWGGKDSGALLFMARQMGSGAQGVTHSYYFYKHSGGTVKVGMPDEGRYFGEFARRWIRERGGTCQFNLN
jgi:hypothetical protein